MKMVNNIAFNCSTDILNLNSSGFNLKTHLIKLQSLYIYISYAFFSPVVGPKGPKNY